MQYKNDEIIPVKDFYYYVETDLGDTKMYSKKNMFISKVNLRDQKLNNLLDEL